MELVKQNNTQVALNDINEMQQMASALLKTGHYQKLGQAGIFAVIQMARSIGTDITQALNGGLYPVDGKVEIDGRLMMSLIRQAGHSITKDKRSTETNCILHGKRADTGDTWTESFGIDDAKKAGLLSRGVYAKYGRDMFQWRALSRLARFLFPDVIKGCYVQGEIKDSPGFNDYVDPIKEEACAKEIECEKLCTLEEKIDVSYVDSISNNAHKEVINEEQYNALKQYIADDIKFETQIVQFLNKHYNIKDIKKIPLSLYDRILSRAKLNYEAKNDTK